MEIVKLTKDEIETLVEVIVRRCYENYEFHFYNGKDFRLFRYDSIPTIVDESFFEILPRFAEIEDKIYIEETQTEEICEKIKESLNCDYEVFDEDSFFEALYDYEYNRNHNNLIDWKNWVGGCETPPL